MEAVIFDGKEYTKASVVAKKFGYTADYLGQLCRGKKVDARMVGRSWYINIDSLDSHRDTRYKVAIKEGAERTTSLGPVDAKKPRSHYLSRIDVEPILKKKTVALYQQTRGGLIPVPVKYEADDHSLIPRVNRDAVSKSVPIKPAEAEVVEVIDTEKRPVTVFKAGELPEVYLRGKISVTGLEEADKSLILEESEEFKIQPEIKTGRIEKDQPTLKETDKPRLVKVKLLKRKSSVGEGIATSIGDDKADKITKISVKDGEFSKKTPEQKTQSSKIIPQPIRNTEVKVFSQSKERSAPVQNASKALSFKPESVKHKEAIKPSSKKSEITSTSWLLPGAIVVLALVLSGALLFVSLEISVKGGSYYVNPEFDSARFESMLLLVKNNFNYR